MRNIDYDLEYNNAIDKMAKGGALGALFKINTPTGAPSKLTYIQQLLVRTKAFKEWFGDWENLANRIVSDRAKETPLTQVEKTLVKSFWQNDKSKGNLSRNQIILSFYFLEYKIKDVSHTIDYDTLEPQPYWHGTQAEEFFEFKTNVRVTGRPYSYFALNKSYSENFSQDKTLYSVFTCIKNPYIYINYKVDKGFAFLSEVFIDYGLKNNLDSAQIEQIAKDTKYKYVKDYVFNNVRSEDVQFWRLMSRDNKGEFKSFLQSLGYDGVMYVEEIREDADITQADEFTRAVTIFEPNQVKLADGRNTEFSALNNDIRYEKGGLIAPNGKKSNLTEEQYKLVRTPEFKKWFGDWENDPQNSSKVVDENGEPLIVWHGGEVNNAFDKSKIGKNDEGWYGYGFYFTEDKTFADSWGKSKPYFIKIKDAFDIIKKGITHVNPFYTNSKIETDKKISEGFDGSIFKLSIPNEYVVYYEFENNIKLADGTNTQFNSESDDIRYAEGGKTKMDRYEHLLGIQRTTPKFAEGGSIATEHGLTNSGKRGGYFEGRSHAEGGIKAWNTTTNSPLEVEGGEVIITKKAVDDDELYEFEGEKLTNKQILSKINESGGGVKFEDGGEIHQCNCSGKIYKYGGETMEDYQIMNRMNSTYNKKHEMKNHKTSYGHNLMRKMKEGGYC